ncbi:MAG TPA: UDP-glucose 4-epimerase GalE [Candidatus Eisenbacteria bacterium]|nr:UDP-glucose 4-epimerase GalE [Candidatus Eisenbacteria bacterium]
MTASNPRVLVAGGAGYIGSHMTRVLLAAGCSVVVFDNLSTGHREAVPEGARFFRGDLLETRDLDEVLSKYPSDAVMHFAASSLVGESVRDPLKYYENNVVACVRLLDRMRRAGPSRLIFSSTAAVYGEPERVPILEGDRTRPLNPYGRTKLAIEHLLEDVAAAHELSYVSLRYFNACGAHPSGETGERHEPETHLIPNLLKAAGSGEPFTMFGDDYDTPDGTCVRDYVHVMDLARAHLAALRSLEKGRRAEVFNLGNGTGYSVRQILAAAERVTGRRIQVRTGPRRPGDPARLVACAEKAQRTLGWKATAGLDEILRDAWNWERSLEARAPRETLGVTP